MRCLALLFLCLLASTASARQIDLAVIQFPEPKTEAELNAALAGTQLAEIVNADRTVTKVPYLKGGTVLFAQSGGPGILDSSTRFGVQRADVSGSYSGGRLDVRIDLSEGVKSGLRNFSSRTYRGAAPLPQGSPRVVSLRTISRKTQSTTKGVSKVVESTTCHAIIAQIR